MLHSPVLRDAAAAPRILIPIHSFEPGGVERVALRLSEVWRRRGVRAHLVVGRAQGPLQDEIPAAFRDVLQRHGRSTASFETFWMIGHLPRRIRRLKPDLLFCPGNSYAIVGVMMKLLLGKACPPVLLKVSNDLIRRDLPWPVRQLYYCWLRLQGRLIDRFVAIAEPMRDEIATMMRVEPDRIDMIEDGVLSFAEFERMAALRVGPRKPRAGRHFLAVGRLAKQKNFGLLLRAFARMAGPDDRLTIVGDGPERRKLEQMAERLGIVPQLALPGHVHPIESCLADADCFVMSSDYEGMPAALIEALAAGLPVIATDCCVSMADLLGHGTVGRLVPIGNEDALARAMKADLMPRTLAARRQAARFIVEHAADAYLSLIEPPECAKTELLFEAECGLGEPVASPA